VGSAIFVTVVSLERSKEISAVRQTAQQALTVVKPSSHKLLTRVDEMFKSMSYPPAISLRKVDKGFAMRIRDRIGDDETMPARLGGERLMRDPSVGSEAV